MGLDKNEHHIENIYDQQLRDYLKVIEVTSKHVRSLLDDYFGNEAAAAAVNLGFSERLEEVLIVKHKILKLLPQQVVSLLEHYDFSEGTNPNRENILKIFNT